MVDAYTTTGSVDFAQTAYDQMAYFALRPELYFDAAADVKPTRQSMPGATVTFTIVNDLAIADTPLNESVDVSAVAMSDSQIPVALGEYGNAVITTAKLRGESFVEIDPVVSNVIGYNAGVSIDSVARNVLQAGTNVDYAKGTGTQPTARNQILAANTLLAANVRFEKARLRAFNVATFGGMYVSYIHPNVAYDLTSETGTQGWRDPHVYSQPGELWNGELGAFENFRFIETPRAPVFAGLGSSSTDVYGTLFMGRQSLAKAHSIVDGNGPVPHVVPGPVTDKLRRFVPWGWYWLGNYAIFRQPAVRRVESASSLAYVDPAIDAGE
jgi:N4-gp56 family major capsid protein